MDEDQPDKEDLASRLSEAMGGGDPETRKPVSLTESLYQRIVDVTRQEVSQTTEVLGEVIIQIGRLERRVNSLAVHFEGDQAGRVGDADGGGGIGLAPLQERLDRLEGLLSRAEGIGGVSAGETADLQAISDLFDSRLAELSVAASGAGTDAGEVGQIITRGLAEIRTALLTAQPDLSPVVRAVTHGIDDMRAELAELRSTPFSGGDGGDTDTEFMAQWLVDTRAALNAAVAELREGIPAQPDTGLSDAISRLESSLADVRDNQAAAPDRLVGELDSVAGSLRADIAAIRSAIPEAEPVDLRPVLEALHHMADGLRGEFSSVAATEAVDLGPLHQAIAELRMALPAPPEPVNLGPVLQAVDDLRSAIPEPAPAVDLSSINTALSDLRQSVDAREAIDPDVIGRAVGAEVAGKVQATIAGATADLDAKIDDVQAAVSAVSARYAAKMDELRNGLADDSERLAERIDAVADRASREPDFGPIVESIRHGLSEVRDSIPEPAPPVYIGPLRDEIAAVRSAQDSSIDALRTALREASEQSTGHVSDELQRLRQSLPTPDPVDLSPLTSAVEDLRSELRSNDLSGVPQALDHIRSHLDRPTDPVNLQPTIDALRQALDDTARDLKDSFPASPDIESIISAVSESGSASTAAAADQADRVAAEIASLRSHQEQQGHELIARLEGAVADLRTALPQPTDLSPVVDRIEQISIDSRGDSERAAEEARSKLDEIVTALRTMSEQGDDRGERLGSLLERIAVVEQLGFDGATRAATLAQQLEDLAHRDHEAAQALAQRFDGLVETTTETNAGMVSQVTEMTRATGETNEALGVMRQRIEERDPSDAVLGEVRTMLERVADEMSGVRASNDPEVLLTTFDQGAEQAVERLQASAEEVLGRFSETSKGVMARIDRRDSQMATLRVDLETAVQQRLQQTEAELQRLTTNVESSMTDLARAVGGDLTKVNNGMLEVGRDVGAARERILELDRNLTGLRNEVGGTAEIAQASYQTADTLQALIPAVASLENRVGSQLDDLTARLDALAALVADRVPGPGQPGDTQARVAVQMGSRIEGLRQVAAGVSEALRNDRAKRRNKSLGSGKG